MSHIKYAVATTVALVFAQSVSPVFGAGISAKEIMSKSEDARKVREVTANCKLVQSGAGSESKTKEFHWWRKIADNQIDYRTLVRFVAPSTVRGEGILILEKDKSGNEVLLYLPAYKKVRRVENQQQTGRFMGSEFSYSDIATPHLDDYSYSGGKQDLCPADSGAKGNCYAVESKPANDRVAERTGYSRIMNWVRADNFMVVKAEFYDPQGSLIKRLAASDIQPAGNEAGKWIAHQTHITNLKTGGSSQIEFADVKVNGGIRESVFTQQNLASDE
jgi:outer membrane lipoprotein-sorting protein